MTDFPPVRAMNREATSSASCGASLGPSPLTPSTTNPSAPCCRVEVGERIDARQIDGAAIVERGLRDDDAAGKRAEHVPKASTCLNVDDPFGAPCEVPIPPILEARQPERHRASSSREASRSMFLTAPSGRSAARRRLLRIRSPPAHER
jgi:hypothetical protein